MSVQKIITTLLLLICYFSTIAEISVKSFRKLESDMTARIDAPKKDQNGDVCAIIKVVSTQTGFSFDGGQLGIVQVVPKSAELWVYVPYGLKRISISHDKLGILRDYILPMPIEKATVYEMVLVSGRVETTVIEEISSQWLVINPQPTDAAVYINDEFKQTGAFSAKLKLGTYSYRVEAPFYHTEAGKLEITDSKKTIDVKLKPAFGYITINSAPEQGARISIDGKPLPTNTPCKSDMLASGEHTIQVLKDMYQPYSAKIMVYDDKITPLNVNLLPNFSELTVNVPLAATLFINNQQKSVGSWSGRLSAGVYSLEVRLDKHSNAKQDIELVVGDKKTITLQPTPLFGSIDVVSTPLDALILINGKEYGNTPNTIRNLLIGDYTIEIKKAGYKPVNKIVSVSAGKNTEVVEILQNLNVDSKNDNKQQKIDLEWKVAINPKDTASWNSLIEIYAAAEDSIGIEDVLKRAITAIPTVPKWLITMGYIRARQGNGAEALFFCNKAFRYVDDEPSPEVKSIIYYYYASSQYTLGNKEVAFKSFELGYLNDNSNTQLLNDFAYYLAVDKKDYSRALSMSLKTIQKEPKNYQYLDTYAWILFLSGDYKTANQYMKLAIENLPAIDGNGIFYDHYGDILWFNGNRAEAVEVWKLAISVGYKTATLEMKVSTKSYLK